MARAEEQFIANAKVREVKIGGVAIGYNRAFITEKLIANLATNKDTKQAVIVLHLAWRYLNKKIDAKHGLQLATFQADPNSIRALGQNRYTVQLIKEKDAEADVLVELELLNQRANPIALPAVMVEMADRAIQGQTAQVQ